jgi:hypothetical protein
MLSSIQIKSHTPVIFVENHFALNQTYLNIDPFIQETLHTNGWIEMEDGKNNIFIFLVRFVAKLADLKGI